MDKIRLRFTKTGRAVYISHLDLVRTVQRALNRAGVPVRYSSGFNPHALISVLLPLSIGVESLCDLMDIRVREEVDLTSLPAKLTAVMPEGISILSAYEDGRKSVGLKWLRMRGLWIYEEQPDLAALEEFFNRPEVPVLRRTKRGEGIFDLRTGLQSLQFSAVPKGIAVEAVISAQEPTLNPDLLVSALRQSAPTLAPTLARFTRVENYDAEMQLFA